MRRQLDLPGVLHDDQDGLVAERVGMSAREEVTDWRQTGAENNFATILAAEGV